MIFPRKFTSHPDIPMKTKNAATVPVDDMKARIHVTIGTRKQVKGRQLIGTWEGGKGPVSFLGQTQYMKSPSITKELL